MSTLHRPHSHRISGATAGIEGLIGVSALVGGILFVARPDGSLLGMSTGTLAGSPFADFLLPGLALALGIGLVFVAAAVLTVREVRYLPEVTMSVALLLMVWLLVEAAAIGFQWQQAPIAALAVALAVLAGWLPDGRGR
jgi:hypothetical protein